MSIIAITDYFTEPGAEEVSVLGELIGMEVNEDTEVLMVWHAQINEEYCRNLPKLRGVQRYGVGYDNLDLKYLQSRNIICCNNPDYGTDEVSDTAVTMIMNIARGVSIYNFAAKNFIEGWQENVLPALRRVSQLTVGVIGAGRIGGSVILKCNALKFKTVFYDPYKERGYEKMLGARRVDDLESLLAEADIVSIHTPLTIETRGMVDELFIEKMKNGASLVNTARGNIVKDLDLLLKALESGRIANVALDVLPEEPPKENALVNAWCNVTHPLQGRIIINPHTSYYSQEAFKELRLNAAKNALRVYANKEPFNKLF